MTEFESWLRKGLGRAAVVLKREGGQEHRGPLMYACTRNITYDRQCEEERGPYLLDLIRLSGEPEFYRHCVITARAAQSRRSQRTSSCACVPAETDCAPSIARFRSTTPKIAPIRFHRKSRSTRS
jgi:hypothetical protein